MPDSTRPFNTHYSEPAEVSPRGELVWFPNESLPPIRVVLHRLFGINIDAAARGDVALVCPLHDDESPSFSVNPLTNVFKCHTPSCPGHVGGNVVTLVSLARNVPTREVRQWLIDNSLMRRPGNFWTGLPEPTLYDYVDAHGTLLYQVGRKQISPTEKKISQRRPKADGSGWSYSLTGIERVPYHLPDVVRAANASEVIFVVEGEKNADHLRAVAGVCVTTNSGGAAFAWPATWAQYFVGTSRVVVLGDNDEAGIRHAKQVASVVATAVPDTRIFVPLPGLGEGGDISDWLDLGHTYAELSALVESAPVATPYTEVYPRAAVPALLSDLTDTGNGHWFKACVGDGVRWVRDADVLLAWNGQQWTQRIAPHAYTEEAVRMMRLAVVDVIGQEREAFEEWAVRSGSMNLRKQMIEAAKPLLMIESNDLDSHGMKLNVQNGVLDLESFELLPHSRDLYLTKLAPISYEPDAECPRWLAWLNEAMNGDEEMVAYVQRIMGEALVAKAKTRRMFFAYGPHGTGKTTITNVMRAMLGEYAGSIDFATVAMRDNRSGSAASPDVARLRGLRLITAVESRDSDRLDAAKLKLFMGGDTVVARNNYEGNIEFTITATLFFSGNERPTIDADASFWSKLKMLPFKHQFANQDVDFFERVLQPELPGIFAWAVEGLRKLVADNWALTDPAAVLAETEEYREDANPLARFLEECCDMWSPESNRPREQYKVTPANIRRVYYWWADDQGIRYPLGERKISTHLSRVQNLTSVKQGHGGDRFWLGLRVKQTTINAMEQVAGSRRREHESDF